MRWLGLRQRERVVKKSPDVLSDQDTPVLLDLSNVKRQLAKIKDEHLDDVVEAIEGFKRKIEQRTWRQIGSNTGFRFKYLKPKITTKLGDRIASVRLSQKFRARVFRRGQYMVILSIHPDHDSAYE